MLAHLAMENEDSLERLVAAARRNRRADVSTPEQQLFKTGLRADINGVRNMSTSELEVEAAVDEHEARDVLVVVPIEQVVELHIHVRFGSRYP